MRSKLRHVTGAILAGLSVATAAGAESPPPAPLPGRESLEAKLAQLLGGSSGLTADLVAARAEATSPTVLQKRSDVEAAERRFDQARDQLLPKLSGTARYTRASDIPVVSLGPAPYGFQIVPVLDNWVAEAKLTVPVSDYLLKLSTSLGAASRSRRAAELTERAVRLEVAANARVAYYQWVRAQGLLVVAEQALVQAKGHLIDAERAFQVGNVPTADVLRATSAEKSDELLVARAANERTLAEEQVRVMMHDGPEVTYAVGENILQPLPPFPAVGSPAALEAEALESRLEIRALDETAYSLRDTATLQRRANFPRVDLAASAMYANPNPRIFPPTPEFRGTWDASVLLSWTPSDIPLTSAAAAETDAKASGALAQKASLRDAVRIEVTQAWNALRESEIALETTRSALAASEENYRVRGETYRVGRSSSVEVTDAETDLTRARVEAVDAMVDARVARVRLARALGRDVGRGR